MGSARDSHFVYELDRRNVKLEAQIAEGRRQFRAKGIKDEYWSTPEALNALLRMLPKAQTKLIKKDPGLLDELEALSVKSGLFGGMLAMREAVRANPQSVPTDVELAAFGGATSLFNRLETLAVSLNADGIRDVEFWRGVLVDLRRRAVEEIEEARDRAGWQEWLKARVSGGCSPSEGG